MAEGEEEAAEEAWGMASHRISNPWMRIFGWMAGDAAAATKEKELTLQRFQILFWPCMISNLTHDGWVFAFLMFSL